MAQLFGFEIVRKKEAEEKAQPDRLVTFAPEIKDDGAVVVAEGGVFGTYLDLEGSARTESDLVAKYREMSLQPEVESAIDDISKIHINNYKTLASIYMIFEYQETDNPKQLMECKHVILSNGILVERKQQEKDLTLEKFQSQPKDVRLLTYKLMIDKLPNHQAKTVFLAGAGTQTSALAFGGGFPVFSCTEEYSPTAIPIAAIVPSNLLHQ